MISCPICEFKIIVKYDSDFYVCSNCEYQFNIKNIKDSAIKKYYNGDLGLLVQAALENTGNFKLKPYHKKTLNFLEKQFNKQSFHRICDIGCGTGTFLNATRVYNFTCYGYDLNKEHISIAKKTFGLKNIRVSGDLNGYCKRLSLPRNFFDVITMFEVLEHVRNVNSVVESVYRYLRPGGYFIFSTPNFDRIPIKERWDKPPIHLSRFKEKNIRILINKHNLDIEKITFYNELGYYCDNIIHRLSFSRNVSRALVEDQGNPSKKRFSLFILRYLTRSKKLLCKIVDLPLFSILFLFPKRGHTMLVFAKKK